MEDPPKDPRVGAMLALLFGQEWDKLEGPVDFEKTPIESWVYAVESMLAAADAVDPIRVAVRDLASAGGEQEERPEVHLPSRTASS